MFIRRLNGLLLVGFACVFLFGTSTHASQEIIDNGVQWLMGNQDSEGSWSGVDKRLSFRDTAEVVRTLKELGETSSLNFADAVLWLEGMGIDNNDYLGRRVIAQF